MKAESFRDFDRNDMHSADQRSTTLEVTSVIAKHSPESQGAQVKENAPRVIAKERSDCGNLDSYAVETDCLLGSERKQSQSQGLRLPRPAKRASQ
jgi:hypothetical protein